MKSLSFTYLACDKRLVELRAGYNSHRHKHPTRVTRRSWPVVTSRLNSLKHGFSQDVVP